MRRYGWLAFWVQLSMSVVSGTILLFSVAFTSQVGGLTSERGNQRAEGSNGRGKRLQPFQTSARAGRPRYAAAGRGGVRVCALHFEGQGAARRAGARRRAAAPAAASAAAAVTGRTAGHRPRSLQARPLPPPPAPPPKSGPRASLYLTPPTQFITLSPPRAAPARPST
jgi:hypothetical protein